MCVEGEADMLVGWQGGRLYWGGRGGSGDRVSECLVRDGKGRDIIGILAMVLIGEERERGH